MHAPIDPAFKATVLEEIKQGMRVVEAAVKYKISDKTIYSWLRAQVDNTGTSNAEVAKLRRENQELKELIGLLTLQKKRSEKNSHHS